ncbi:MAG: N-acetyl-gamma-glutamyl-phosphate reductase [Oscillospiraceae bacterium]|jgi:N-acetyl-gamma-glutamyl-phosphate reductase|nr:N-acetyl-gamma-glutamyl-phosphate reductase [Oscillospiraceae bacterium]
MLKIFIDGKAGTTGLRIAELVAARGDLELITLPEDLRKDTKARRNAIFAADAVFLCLPDTAARESVALAHGSNAVILDASTAHRTAAGWAYGFPELGADFRKAIQTSKRIAVPGCHASGFLALVVPLLRGGLLPRGVLLHCFSLTGYTGGGRAMMEEYTADTRAANDFLQSPRQYALGQSHKHLPEMTRIAGLTHVPVFSPIVADFDRGMQVTVQLHQSQFASPVDLPLLLDCYRQAYCGQPMIKITQSDAFGEDAFAASNTLRGHDSMELTVQGNRERVLLIARFDNLGKGASGAAMQCLNIAFGLDETLGLCF